MTHPTVHLWGIIDGTKFRHISDIMDEMIRKLIHATA